MAVPTKIADLSTTAASNSPSGSDSIGTSLDDFLRIIQAFERILYNTSIIYCPSVGGTADVITLTAPTYAALTVYRAGQGISWIASGDNTTAVTVNVDSVGAAAVVKGINTALGAGDIQSGSLVKAVYDGTNFVIKEIITTANITDGAITTAKLATNAITTVKITDSNVTLAKIANAAANSRILGAGNSGVGAAYTELTPATVMAFTNALTGFAAAAGTVSATDSVLTAIQKIVGNATSITPVASVNLSAVEVSGTYSRTGTTVTVTMVAHGMSTGHSTYLDFTTGAGTDGYYPITVTGVDTYTIVDAASGSTSGNVTRKIWARNAVNITSISKNAIGDIQITGSVAAASAFPKITATGQGLGGNAECIAGITVGTTPTSTVWRISSANAGGSLFDTPYLSVTVTN